ncbi:cellulase signal transduction associated dehydrogenase [Apiospora arundinis]
MSLAYTTKTHSAPYPRISPAQPHLSAAAKTVLIVGGSTGIGRATAAAFLAAGATRLVLTGRREEVLAATAAELAQQSNNTVAQILTFAVDVTDEAGMEHVFVKTEKAFGNPLTSPKNNQTIYMRDVETNVENVLKHRWSAFETNVRGPASLARLVVRHASSASSAAAATASENKDGVREATPTRTPTTLIQLSTAGALFPANGALPMSAYAASKLAAVKVMEYVGAETDPGVLRVLSVHPGIFPGTEGGQAMVKESGIAWEGDDINLPAHFLVWAASQEAEFLRNKLVFATWDVDELVARREEISNTPELLIGLNGFPRAI